MIVLSFSLLLSSAFADPNGCPHYLIAKSKLVITHDAHTENLDYTFRPSSSQVIFTKGIFAGDGGQYKFYRFDSKSGKTTELKSVLGPNNAYIHRISDDPLHEQYLIFQSSLYDEEGHSLKKNIYYFFDTAKDKLTSLELGQYEFMGISGKKDSEKRFALFLGEVKQDYIVFDMKTMKKKKLKTDSSFSTIKFIPDSHLLLGMKDDGSLVLMDLAKSRATELLSAARVKGKILQFEPVGTDRVTLLTEVQKADGSREKTIMQYSISEDALIEVEMLKGLQIRDNHYGGKDYSVFNPATEEYFHLPADLKQLIPVGKNPHSVSIDMPDTRHITFGYSPDDFNKFYSYKIYDRVTGVLYDLPNLFQDRVYPNLNNSNNVVHFNVHDSETKLQTFYRYDLEKKTLAIASAGEAVLEGAQLIGKGMLYDNGGTYRYVNLKDWKSVSLKAGPLKRFDIATYKSLKVEEELPAIEEYFSKKLYNKNPYWALPYLMMLLKKSEVLFETFVATHGLANEAKLMKVISRKTYDETLLDSWKKDVKKYIEYSLQKNPEKSDTTIEQWKHLVIFKPVIRRLNKSYLKDVSMHIARSLANGAYYDEYDDILHAKLLKFAHQTVRKWFGMESRVLTDLDLVRNTSYRSPPNSMTPILMGSEPLPGVEKMNEFGFYYKKLPILTMPATINPGELVLDRKFEWTHGANKYVAKVTAKALDVSTEVFSPKILAPDYESMWKDGEFNGMLMIGDGFGGEADLIGEYIDYYQEQGFKFKRDTKVIDDVGAYLSENIKNGKLDYFIKEAHSDGDDRNLFRYVSSGKLHIGTKKHKNGRIEKIIFVENIAGKGIGKLLSNAEFGSWMRERATAGHGNFIYFNTSCSSTVKVSNEVESAHTPTLIVLGGQSTMETFANDELSGMRAVLHGVRNGLTFEEIRKLLEATKNYKDGYDKFVFPDEADFESEVRSRIKTPLDINIVIKDQNKKTYEIDDAPTQQNDE